MPTTNIEVAWGMLNGQATKLAHMNDGDGGEDEQHTFAQIADWIDENVPVED